MKKLNLTFIDNESHGYVKISKYDLLGMNINPNEFSSYSYYNMTDGYLYLEEDCDVTKLIKLLEERDYTITNSEGYIDLKTVYVDSYYFNKQEFIRNENIRG